MKTTERGLPGATERRPPAWLLAAAALALPVSSFVYVVREPTALSALEKVGALFLSWPYVTVVLVIAFFVLFRRPIEAAIGRIQRVKGLGGELELQPQAPAAQTITSVEADRESRAEAIEAKVVAAEPIAETVTTPHVPDEIVEILRSLGEPVPDIRTMKDATEFAGRMLARASFAQEDAQKWKFHYLSYFLVTNTKLVLHWFQQRRFSRRDAFENDWKFVIPDPVARAVILNVLVGQALLEETDGAFSVTREGKAFVEFLERTNSWHQPALAPSERPAFYPPVVAAPVTAG